MDNLFLNLLFICPLLFLAGLIDSISGGGGIIALPSYIMTGMPLSFAYGCNKFQSCIGTSAALYRYAKSGYVDIKAALISAIPAIAGSFISTRIMLILDDSIKSAIIIVAMIFIITLTLITNKVSVGDDGEVTHIRITVRNSLLLLGIGLFLGLYDGFFGPGGGTIALMLYSLFFKYDFRTASGNVKLINLASNVGAVVTSALSGKVLYGIGLIAAVFSIVGHYLGAGVTIKNGARLVRPIIFVVLTLLCIKVIGELVV